MKKAEIKIFESEQEIISALNSVNFDLENKESLEDFNLFTYLKILAQNSLELFPYFCKKWESPDYLMQFNNREEIIGIEITHATVEHHFENLKKVSKIPGSYVEINKNGSSNFRMPTDPLCNDPFYEDQAESLLEEIIIKRFKEKYSSFNKPYFGKLSKNVLLIRNFTDLPIQAKKLESVLSEILMKINCENITRISFNEVTIIWGDNLMFRYDKNLFRELK